MNGFLRNKGFWAAVFALVVVLIFTLNYYPIKPGAFAGAFALGNCPAGTGTISSIDQASFLSNTPTFSGTAWRVIFNTLPSGECLFGKFDPGEIVDGQTGKSATDSFTIGVKNSQQSCNYDITPTGNAFYAVQAVPINWNNVIGTHFDQAVRQCESGGTIASYGGTPEYVGVSGLLGSVSGTLYCFRPFTQPASVGNVALNNLAFSTDVQMNVGGQTYAKSVSTMASSTTLNTPTTQPQQFFLDDNRKVYVQWGGNLGSGLSCPDSGSQDVQAVQFPTGWDFVQKSAVDSYLSQQRGTFFACLNGLNYKTATTQLANCVANFNYVASKVSQVHPSFTMPATGAKASISGNVARITTDASIVYPQLTFYIDSSVLGIFKGSGKPRIDSLTAAKFVSDYSSTVNVQVTNVGGASDAFYAVASCGSPISALSQSQRISLDPSQQGTLYVPISASSSTSQCGNCQVTVYASIESDSKSVSACVDARPGTGCTVGATSCYQNRDVYQCDASGNSVVKAHCPKGCAVGAAGANCIESGKGGGNALLIIVLIVALVAAGLGGYSVWQNRRRGR